MEVMRFDCSRDTYHSMHPMPRQNSSSSTRMVRSCSRRTHAAMVCAMACRMVSRPRKNLAGRISRLRFTHRLTLGEYMSDEVQQGRQRVEMTHLPRDNMLDTARHVSRVQCCIGVKLHHKGPLRGEPGASLSIQYHPAYSLTLYGCAVLLRWSMGAVSLPLRSLASS